MKTRSGTLIVSLTIVSLLLPIINLGAIVFTNLYDFNCNLGCDPSSLVLWGNTLFGTTGGGGSGGAGTVFKINTDGTGYTNLYCFNGDNGNNPGGLFLAGDTLYGTAAPGGTNGSILFSIKTDGTGFTNLNNFTNDDGNALSVSLSIGNTLVGTIGNGGSNGNGTVSMINTDGTCFTNIYTFSADAYTPFPIAGQTDLPTNYDGVNPGGVILEGNILYGVAGYGGTGGNGTVFRINLDGTGFTNLHSFTRGSYNSFWDIANSDGANPQPGLVLSGNTLYGTTQQGGTAGEGTVFRINTDGTGFTNLHNFSGSIKTNGYYPQGSVVLYGSTLYGTTLQGGVHDYGAVYRINIDGTGFAVLYSFNLNDGQWPGSLLLCGSGFYGSTLHGGGVGGMGNLFLLSLPVFPIPLQFQIYGNNTILRWDNPAFSLQAAPMVTGVYTNISGATSPYTNANTRSQMFYRLQGNQ